MTVTFKNQTTALTGDFKKVGDVAPEVALVNKELANVKVGGAQGTYQIINVVPSLDTGVCATQTKTFNQKASSLANTVVFVVSADLPFAQNRFCTTEGISNLQTLSDFRKKEFGKAYGLLIAEGPLEGLLARAVIVVNPEGKIVYQEVCAEITSEPDYEAPLKFLQ